MHCGAPTQATCAECGEAIVPGARFCLQCGARLEAAGGPGRSGAAAGGDVPSATSERRLVSVLFADLVGFTTISEHRDPEEIRELLSEYFERCRTIIARYGGTVEKFIGDAVMAVWGTPVAREDDAERAVRAALALTAAVTALGGEVGMPGLRVRAGVLTGSAAVEIGAEGEGMVLGDTVNTASRLQAVAAPGTVLVDDVTRRASEAAIAYEDAGTHTVKGREQAVRAWTALRVVAGAGGSGRGAGLEAPFSGRAAELQAIVDAGERSAHERRAELVAVVGEAGLGKSRLLWEFYKYLDGIQEVRWWHQGRCLSYGEGVAYWALAEMIRGRARIGEEDPPAEARGKLKAAVELYVSDERERRLVEPRLAHLLRLEERADADRADLFSGWRLFFERMAEQQPLILVFEDLQWADSGLLDFIDYLLEWSAELPIFILALGRTELRDRRPAWQPLVLAPLEPTSISQILDGLVPGLPDGLAGEIVHRAEGIPLYAVETIRMLQDRGLLVQEGAQYVLTGEVEDLEVPETLHALVASRLDGLSPEERMLLQNASVLGQTFSPAALAVVSERREEDVRGLLDGLVAKQVISRDDDPRSPERGQYEFLQALLRSVAYGTLGRRTRKARHLSAARYLRDTWPGGISDIAEVLASHYLEAIRVDPEAADVSELRAHARETLIAAGQAAASLALGPEADRYLEQAAELAEDDAERARLYEQAGDALRRSGDNEHAQERLRRALELVRSGGDPTGGWPALKLSEILGFLGRMTESDKLIEPLISADPDTVEPVLRARSLLRMANNAAYLGNLAEAGPWIEEALAVLEDSQLWPELGMGLISRGVYLVLSGRRQEALGVLRQTLVIASDHGLPALALRAHFNMAGILIDEHRLEESLAEVAAGLAVGRERGDRSWDEALRGQAIAPSVMLGRWDEALRDGVPLLDVEDRQSTLMATVFLPTVAAARGDDALLERCRTICVDYRGDTNVELRGMSLLALAVLALNNGDADEARRLAADGAKFAYAGELRTEAMRVQVEAAFHAGDEDLMEEMAAAVEVLPPARRLPLLRAARARLRAELSHQRGNPEEAQRYEQEAEKILRDHGTRTLLAAALLDRVRRRGEEAALDEARGILQDLGAERWLEQLEATAHETTPARSASRPA
jgi:class 3 adenylate cyclase/tetratricopeptide (TPR) repeat protein